MSDPLLLQQPASASSSAASSDDHSGSGADANVIAVTFRSLGLCASLCQVAVAACWKAPTALQRAVLPAMLSGRDVLCLHGVVSSMSIRTLGIVTRYVTLYWRKYLAHSD